MHVRAGGGSDLLPRHVGGRERLADDARVDEHDVDALLADAIGEVRVLLALRVECSNENDGRHRSAPSKLVVRLAPGAVPAYVPGTDRGQAVCASGSTPR